MKISIFLAAFQVVMTAFHAGSIATNAENVSSHLGRALGGPERSRILKKKRKASKTSKASKAASGKGKGSSPSGKGKGSAPSSQPTKVPSASPSNVPSFFPSDAPSPSDRPSVLLDSEPRI